MLHNFMPTKTRTMKMTRKYTTKMGGGFRRPLATTSSCVTVFDKNPFFFSHSGPLLLRNIGGSFSNTRPVRGQKLLTALFHLRMALNTGRNDFQSLLCKAIFYERGTAFEPMKPQKMGPISNTKADAPVLIWGPPEMPIFGPFHELI